jgi:hypothetical protein
MDVDERCRPISSSNPHELFGVYITSQIGNEPDCHQKVDTLLFEADWEETLFIDMTTIEEQIVQLDVWGHSRDQIGRKWGEDVAGSRGSEPRCHQKTKKWINNSVNN